MEDKHRLTVTILILVIVLLAMAVLYAFVVKPAVSGYIVNQQNLGLKAGYNQALSDVVNQVGQVGFVQIPVGANQTVLLRPFTQQEIAQLQQAQAQQQQEPTQ